ncbi:hypothetical protein OGATHE_004704 [Ogataea polymorpha]|uniref:Uncharacterized protein n=1 Tax=Ogataea polymorpha TaxID=460523 RepID=A0A9P8NZL2_9ASCO|nr:hypothetical protein OGATHE_004704 [Ogataea polymorpha]
MSTSKVLARSLTGLEESIKAFLKSPRIAARYSESSTHLFTTSEMHCNTDNLENCTVEWFALNSRSRKDELSIGNFTFLSTAEIILVKIMKGSWFPLMISSGFDNCLATRGVGLPLINKSIASRKISSC